MRAEKQLSLAKKDKGGSKSGGSSGSKSGGSSGSKSGGSKSGGKK